jgi:hypothetical protein
MSVSLWFVNASMQAVLLEHLQHALALSWQHEHTPGVQQLPWSLFANEGLLLANRAIMQSASQQSAVTQKQAYLTLYFLLLLLLLLYCQSA